ncbi:MAG: dimethylsulfone monooxygenase [Alphaproteobacteria bacterium]|nr:dimethylsulfone monooxygenase [Alphaproteobacteria bacterium]
MNEAIRESGTRGLANGPDKAFRFAVDMIRRGEELGFETTLLAERWMGTDHSAWLLAAALAPLTSRIELMVAVHPGIVTPQAVAKLAVSLDRISGGRAAINIVNGWWKEEFETFGQAYWPQDDDARYRRMDEFVRVIRGLWQQDVFDFHGEFYNVNGQGLPLKSVHLPHPPIYAGTRNETGKEVIARDGDYWFVDYQTDYRMWERNIEQAAVFIADMRKRAGRHGRTLDFGMSCHVVCADSMDRAVSLANQLEEHGKTDRISFIAARALGPGLVGTPEVIADRIRGYEAAGVGTLMLHFHPMAEGMERFAGEVIPLLRREAA